MEWTFTLKRVRDMIITYSQMYHTDKYSHHSSIIWPVWLNGWMFIYELSECGFESSWCLWNFRYCACFKQGVPWHSSNYRVYIYSETSTWHDNVSLKDIYIWMLMPRRQYQDFQVAVLRICKDKDIKDKSSSWKWINSTKEINNFSYYLTTI